MKTLQLLVWLLWYYGVAVAATEAWIRIFPKDPPGPTFAVGLTLGVLLAVAVTAAMEHRGWIDAQAQWLANAWTGLCRWWGLGRPVDLLPGAADAEEAHARRLLARVIGRKPVDAGTYCILLEAMHEAIGITHECGSPEATDAAIMRAFADAVQLAASAAR